jgi:hypothetical protein
MERHDLTELHYITPIANLGSILEYGVLSHRRAQAFNPTSVAMQEIQDVRAGRRVPGGLQLHDYANLYICARNPMLYKRLTSRREICVLSLLPTALDLDGVVVTDQNAASKYVRFGAGAAGLAIVDQSRTFAEYWTHPDYIEQYRRKAAKCAEVLVPHVVPPEYIRGAYVCSPLVKRAVNSLGLQLTVSINGDLYFGRT